MSAEYSTIVSASDLTHGDEDQGGAVVTPDLISFGAVFDVIKSGRKLIYKITAAFFGIGLLYALLSQPQYTATAVILPGSDTGNSSIMGQGGSGASLAATLLGSSGTSQVNLILALFNSQTLGEKFIKEQNLLPALFPRQWDAANKKWKNNDRFFLIRWLAHLVAFVSRDQGPVRDLATPSVDDGYKQFTRNILSVEYDETTGLISVSFEYKDPTLAAKWANAYVALVYADLRKRTDNEASQAVNYLSNQLKTTSNADVRDTIFSILQQQLSRSALANISSDVLFSVIDRATPPQDISYPPRLLAILLSIVLGGIIGTSFVLLREGWQRKK